VRLFLRDWHAGCIPLCREEASVRELVELLLLVSALCAAGCCFIGTTGAGGIGGASSYGLEAGVTAPVPLGNGYPTIGFGAGYSIMHNCVEPRKPGENDDEIDWNLYGEMRMTRRISLVALVGISTRGWEFGPSFPTYGGEVRYSVPLSRCPHTNLIFMLGGHNRRGVTAGIGFSVDLPFRR
jgi:hypothetical protein